jgi:hypothetical protein
MSLLQVFHLISAISRDPETSTWVSFRSPHSPTTSASTDSVLSHLNSSWKVKNKVWKLCFENLGNSASRWRHKIWLSEQDTNSSGNNNKNWQILEFTSNQKPSAWEKETITEVNRQLGWEKIFHNYPYESSLISRICKEVKKLSRERMSRGQEVWRTNKFVKNIQCV